MRRCQRGSLATLDIQTATFFAVADRPCGVVALLRFPESADSEELIGAYMLSPDFRDDMAGFDMDQIERFEVDALLQAWDHPSGTKAVGPFRSDGPGS